MLPIHMISKESYFIYPSEEDYIGSIRTFAALHRVMIEDNKMAVAWIKPGENASAMLCNIVASKEIIEKVNKREEQIQPPGMHVIRIPFYDDIRERPDNSLYAPCMKFHSYYSPCLVLLILEPLAGPATTAIASQVINKLTLKGGYDPSRYKNPVVQRHYRVLQARALEEPFGEEEEEEMAKEDKTVPMYKAIDKKVGNLTAQWKESVRNEIQGRVRK